ncbi:AAA family ATPase [Nocardia callitridis]|uniref:Uncharacterized protein n=1 Tax=Nocardia callitridis TaxID=648753 RepID=A0ABP9JZU2_9NOCA
MAEFLVLVNGLPGSGKSTLGRSLARTSAEQFLSKDTAKEAIAACVDDGDRLGLGGIAMDSVWVMAGLPRVPSSSIRGGSSRATCISLGPESKRRRRFAP